MDMHIDIDVDVLANWAGLDQFVVMRMCHMSDIPHGHADIKMTRDA